MVEKIKVDMADLNVVEAPGMLVSLGLGSCVGIALYDKYSKVAGLAHIMLPSSKASRNNENKAKFADTAILQLIDQMAARGAKRNRISAKLAGGAQMFAFNNNHNSLLKIGERNIESCLNTLEELGIPVVGKDVGGNYGRTVEFYAETGAYVIKTANRGVKEI